MRLNATTTKPTTRLKPKAKTKQTLQATTAKTTASTTTTTTRTSNAATRQIESFICNLIQLFMVTTTILCTSSAIGSGLWQAQAKPSRWTRSMDTFTNGRQLDELPQDLANSMLAAAAVSAEAAAAAVAVATAKLPAAATATTTATSSAPFLFSTLGVPSPLHRHMQSATTTLRVTGYDSNEIDNSDAVAVAVAGAAEPEVAAAGEAAASVDSDIGFATDGNTDDVERAANDYVIAIEAIGQNTTNEKIDRETDNKAAATQAPPTAAAATESAAATNERQTIMNAKTQDLLSLSQLSAYQTSTVRTGIDKSVSSLQNSLTFQQIGSQRVNGNVAGTTAATTLLSLANANANSQQVLANGSLITPAIYTGNVRTSAKKVDGKYIAPKQQKTNASMQNYIFDSHSGANKHHHHDQRYGPHFEDVQRVGQPTNMTVQAGSSIHLNCRISLLQDKTVSWVRRSAQNEENALDLLTVGLHAYTGDKRYKMEFQYPNNWRLKIINVKKDDEATYECQISTHPPRVIQINLHVNAPKVMIVDEYGDPLQEKYYEIDSTLQLSCVVRNVAMTSSVVFWKHSENVLNYDVTRGGVSVKTELMDDGANSTLSIAKIHKADSGNYTCAISEFQNFTIVVHILNGESFAELHHGAAGTAHSTWQYIIGLYLLLLLRFTASHTVFTYR